jgi:transcriptional regulator with XRE-family HTH domain
MSDITSLEARIATRIAALRKERRMTLKQLAVSIGLSEAYLSRLENHKAPISVDNLAKIAESLGVGVEQFFATAAPDEPLVITRSGKGRQARFRGKKGFVATLLAHGKRRKVMEPLLIDVHTATGEIPLKQHPGQEFNHVIEGTCEFVFGKESYTLLTGDSTFFDASIPHAVRPIPGKKCRLLAVIGSDEFAMHGDLMTLLNDH